MPCDDSTHSCSVHPPVNSNLSSRLVHTAVISKLSDKLYPSCTQMLWASQALSVKSASCIHHARTSLTMMMMIGDAL